MTDLPEAMPANPVGTGPAAKVPFMGVGLARQLWGSALVMLTGAAVLVVVAIVSAVADHGSWTALAAFGFAWLAGAFAILMWAGATVAAAVGLGALPRPVLALGAVVFVAAAILCALSLPVTGARLIVSTALAASLAGVVAAVVAWRRSATAKAASP